jgi:hypothetical protein
VIVTVIPRELEAWPPCPCTSVGGLLGEGDKSSVIRFGGSRSFGAKNNDPLEVFVFTSFSYLWELERSGR